MPVRNESALPLPQNEVSTRPGMPRLLDVLGRSAPVLTLAAMLVWGVAADLPFSSGLRLVAGMLLTQVFPGALVWRTVRPRNGSWLEDLAMGFALGAVVAIAAQTVAGTLQQTWMSAGIPIGVALALVAIPACRRRIWQAETTWQPWWFGPATCLATVAAIPQLLSYFRDVPLTWASGVRQPHVDAYFHLALAGELAHRGPVTFPWVASEPLAYHWFSHAWVANLSVVSGVGLDQTLFRFMPMFLPLAVALIVAAAAIRITGRCWTGPVAAVLTLAGGDLNVFGQATTNHPLDPLSPSLGLSVPILVALVLVLVCRWRGEARSGAFVLIPLLAIAAAGTKGSALPLVVAGLGLGVAAAVLFNRSLLRMLIPELAVIVACLSFTGLVVFHGDAGGLVFNPRSAAEAAPLLAWLGGRNVVSTDNARHFVAVVVMLAVLARGAGILLLLATRSGRRDPLTWFLTGAGLAGVAAVLLFAHPGFSQLYFAYNAIPLLALGSTAGLASLVDRMGSTLLRPALIGLVAGVLMVLLPPQLLGVLDRAGGVPQAISQLEIAGAVLGSALALVALTLRPRWSAVAGTTLTTLLGAGVVTILTAGVATVANTDTMTIRRHPPPAGVLEVSRSQIDAARWIRDHSPVDDVVMTNRHCITTVTPHDCDSRRFVVAAFSERQVLLEGWTGTPKSTTLATAADKSTIVNYWKPELLALNDGFVAQPDAAAAARLAAMGVRWVLVDFTRPHAVTLEPFAHLRFHTPGADVYHLPAAR